jgi:arylsulfate sulfotransferase
MSLKKLGSCFILFLIFLITGCSNQSSLPITITVNPSTAAIAPGQSIQLTAAVVNNTPVVPGGTTGGEATAIVWATTAGKVDSQGNFTAPAGTQSTTVYVTATSKQDRTKYGYATIHVVAPGTVTTTANPQVALYTVTPSSAGNVSVQFGTDTTYGLTTWTQASTGSAIGLLVAGMRPNTEYHMRAVVQFSDGAQFSDADHTFTANVSNEDLQAPVITATTTPGFTPQGGVELLALASGSARPTVTDLNGNVLWTYLGGGPSGTVPNPVKLLSNGDFMINFSNSLADGESSLLEEIDLTGKVIWQMTGAQLNKALAAATCSGCNITVTGTHHDFVMLPNGHLVVIAGTQQVVSGTTVTGDVLIDLDQNRNPVWLWNEFDHLDINRRPYLFPDWTHTNAVIYSPDDGNLVISIRHQNWVIKVNYANGQGDGSIVWHLGYQGDFTLVGGTDPTDWFYAQHGPSFASSNTTGDFALTLFDNGDDRVFASGITCGSTGAPPCLYSTAPVFEINETNMTATLLSNPTTPTYSFFGGNSAILANGNQEFCEAAGGPKANSGTIYEFTQGPAPQLVWTMQTAGEYAYRGQRIPSLYPGVQW